MTEYKTIRVKRGTALLRMSMYGDGRPVSVSAGATFTVYALIDTDANTAEWNNGQYQYVAVLSDVEIIG